MDEIQELKPQELLDHVFCVENLPETKLLVPKLEEPDWFEMDRPSEVFENPNVIINGLVGGVDNPKNLRIKVPRRPQSNRKCLICSKITVPGNFTTTTSKDKKLVIIVGLFITGKMTVEEAKELLNGPRMSYCRIHLSETVNEIFGFLNISKIREMESCSIDNLHVLMTFMNVLGHPYSLEQFKKLLTEFIANMGPVNSPVSSRKPTHHSPPIRRKTRVCNVCSLREYERNMFTIESKFRQLVLMVGCTFSGWKTVEEAQLLITKGRFHCCKSHSSEAVDEIFRVLNIKKVEEMQSCSTDNIEILMQTVNSLSSKLSFSDFQSQLDSFVRKESHNC